MRGGNDYINSAVGIFPAQVIAHHRKLAYFGETIGFQVFGIVFNWSCWGCSESCLQTLIQRETGRVVSPEMVKRQHPFRRRGFGGKRKGGRQKRRQAGEQHRASGEFY